MAGNPYTSRSTFEIMPNTSWLQWENRHDEGGGAMRVAWMLILLSVSRGREDE